MLSSDSMLFRSVYVGACFITLQLFWFFFSLGIITVIPATIALYAVVMEWSKNGFELGIGKSFFYSFKQYFRKTLFLGLNAGFVLILLTYYDSFIYSLIDSELFVVKAIWMFTGGVVFLIVLSIIPLVVTSHLKGISLWKNASVATVTLMPHILLIACIGLSFVFMSIYLPLAVPLFISLFAFIHIRVWQSAVKKLPTDFLDQCLLKYRYR
ncbi:Uncharacterized membrane protein YesL [Gracilibacillus ureilyticus]|uniref:Uncharacterized membrane protein YesL n=1 Tax=Gracilibacillus ureilyticus TaxID=531814 RepID=A0A1H9PW37_9BACI|nr:YesL family protein [Gracilibacillus ureilyticus]SER51989.1 Uncharacterized membrane protein YesL [Gracilibacillus ureilyticus]